MQQPGMASDKTFHLKWNNHLQNLSQLFTTIYSSSALADVTLSCRDGTLKAHKLVLSACSPYFEQIFKDNPCKHPVVILKGIPFSEINQLVEFMYKGSVDVQELDLQSLMHTASELEIRGLAYEARDNAAQMLNVNLEYPTYAPPPPPLTAAPSSYASSHTDVERLKQIHLYQQSMMRAEEMRRRRRDEPAGPSSTSSAHAAVNNILAAAAREMEEARHAAGRSTSIQTEKDEANATETKRDCEELPKKRSSLMSPDDGRDKKKKMTVRFQDDPKTDDMPSKSTSPAVIQNDTPSHKSDNEKSTGLKVVNLSSLQKHSINNEDDSDEKSGKSHGMDEDEETESSGSVSDATENNTHDGNRPHVCDVCDLRFQRASHLSRHKLTHTGERPFTCGGCGRSFARSDKLRVHTKICERTEEPQKTHESSHPSSSSHEYEGNFSMLRGQMDDILVPLVTHDVYPRAQEDNNSEDLRTLLHSVNEGQALLVQYQSEGLLDNIARRRLCNIIINQELQGNPDKVITSKRFSELASQITTLFSKESAAIYFTPYSCLGPSQKMAAKGKLLDTYRQKRKDFSRSGLIARKRKFSSISQHNSPTVQAATSSRIGEVISKLPEETDTNIEEYMLWLKNSYEPWETVELYWNLTRKARFQKYSNDSMSISDYCNDYRALGQSEGLHLEDPTVDMTEAPVRRESTSSSSVMSGMVRSSHRESGHLVFTPSGDVMLPPRAAQNPVILNSLMESKVEGETPRRGRGRPRKTPLPLTPKVKKRRGRPPKTSLDMEGCVLTSGSVLGGGSQQSPVPLSNQQLLLNRKRGRPPKNFFGGIAGDEIGNGLPFGIDINMLKSYGRPNENYNATNLPFGDFAYLTEMMYNPGMFYGNSTSLDPDRSMEEQGGSESHDRTIDVFDTSSDEDEQKIELEENVPPIGVETSIMTVGDCQIVKLPTNEDKDVEIKDTVTTTSANPGSVTITPITTVGDCTIRTLDNNT